MPSDNSCWLMPLSEWVITYFGYPHCLGCLGTRALCAVAHMAPCILAPLAKFRAALMLSAELHYTCHCWQPAPCAHGVLRLVASHHLCPKGAS